MRTGPVTRTAQYAAMLAYVVFLGFPLLWLVSTAFKSAPELSRLNPTLLPTDWTIGNFEAAFQQSQLLSALRNSLVVAVTTAVITTVIALPAAYALSRYKSVVRNIGIGWILVSQVFPFILIVIPVFIVLRNLGPEAAACTVTLAVGAAESSSEPSGRSSVTTPEAVLLKVLADASPLSTTSVLSIVPVRLSPAVTMPSAGSICLKVTLPVQGPGRGATVWRWI